MHSKNKSKTMWNIVKSETNTRDSKDKLPLTNEGKSIKKTIMTWLRFSIITVLMSPTHTKQMILIQTYRHLATCNQCLTNHIHSSIWHR